MIKQWRHYLEGADHKISIQCNHKNLEHFKTSKLLSRRQALWAEVLSTCDVTIRQLEGTKDLPDAPSRRPDYEVGYEKPVGRLVATLVATVERYYDLLPAIKTAQATDSLAIDGNHRLVDIPMIGGPEGSADSG